MLAKIDSKDIRKNVRASVDRYDPKKIESDKRRRQDMAQQRKSTPIAHYWLSM